MAMATTLRDFRRSATALGLGLMALGQDGLAQAQQVPPQAPTLPTSGVAVTPTLSAQVSHSDNATLASNSARQSDTILSLSPGLSVQYLGPTTSVRGQMQVSAVTYLQNTQADRVLPNGRLALHSDWARQGLGLDASVSADQVRSQFTSASSSGTTTADTYTNTRVHVSPFLERELDPQTRVRARLERSQVHSNANSSGLASRPNTSVNGASVALTRQPTRLGYALEANYQDTQADGQAQSLYTQRLVKGTLLYAVTPELDLGPVLGRESTDLPQQHFSGTVKGAQADWHPNERTRLKALVEDRFFGMGWSGDLSYRTSKVAWGLTTTRQVESYASPTASGLAAGGSTQVLLDALLTSRIPNEAERAKAVNDLMVQRNLPSQLGSTRDLYDLNVQLRQNIAARAALMGVRSTVLLTAGQLRSQPLDPNALTTVLGSGGRTRDRYVDTQLNHRVTPLSTLSAGVRFSRAESISLLTGTTTSTRELGLRLTMSAWMSPRSQVVGGLRHMRAVYEGSGGTITENMVFAGLEHRF